MKKVNSNKAPDAVGPYSQAIKTGNLVFLSGQLGIDKEAGGVMLETLAEQTHQIFKNIEYVLAEEKLDLDNVVKTTVYLTDMADFAMVNEIYSTYFSDPFPARSAYAVKGLPLGAQIEIEVIAEVE